MDHKKLLEPEVMIRLYSQGAFPMADEDGEIKWYFPEVRTIIPLDNFNIPRSLKQFIRKSAFEVRYDTDKLEIIRNCANREVTWISEELIEAYKGLDKYGYIHSVGIYKDNKLVGGLYGVVSNGAYFGESMFSKESQASKTALYYLLKRLKSKGFKLLDVQFMTEHLKMFGAIEISLDEYEKLLYDALATTVEF